MALTSPAPRVLADVLPGAAIRDAILVFSGAIFVALSAMVVIPLPWTPVPVTGQTFAVLLTGAALGSIRGLLAMAVYLAGGLVGIGWYADGATAFTEAGTLMPSFGYIVGFVLAGALVGRLAERGWTRTPWATAAAMVLGNVVIYGVGVTWLKFALGAGWGQAIEWGLTPFLGGDALKIVLAAGLFPAVWLGLQKLGMAPQRGARSTSDEA